MKVDELFEEKKFYNFNQALGVGLKRVCDIGEYDEIKWISDQPNNELVKDLTKYWNSYVLVVADKEDKSGNAYFIKEKYNPVFVALRRHGSDQFYTIKNTRRDRWILDDEDGSIDDYLFKSEITRILFSEYGDENRYQFYLGMLVG